MKRFFTYILALFLPVYLLVSLVWGNSVARNRPCKGLCVTVVDSAQAQYVSADEIRTYLEKYVPTDKKTILAEINTEEMEALLSENRLVEEVRCYKTPSGLLRVDISQRVPILRVLGDSAAYFLDEHGEMMPAGLPEAVSVPVIGNGDILTGEDVMRMKEQTNCDGFMIARGAQGNPWIFRQILHYMQTGENLPKPSMQEMVEMMLRHAKMLIDYKGDYTGVREMRKHATWYTGGYRNSAKLRAKINEIESYEELKALFDEVLSYTE